MNVKVLNLYLPLFVYNSPLKALLYRSKHWCACITEGRQSIEVAFSGLQRKELSTMRIRCPDKLEFAFTSLPPYIYKNADLKITGILSDFLTDAVSYYCAGQTNVTYTEVLSGFSGLEQYILNDTADVIFPMPSGTKKKYFIGRPYVPVVESPGIAFFSSKKPDAGDAIVNGLSNGWPALVIVILSAMIAGIAFWFLELFRESRNSKKSTKTHKFSLDGLFNGFYWAMVSMTTVGYGDFYPKSTFGRLLAFIWILLGTVIISLFTASVTTVLLAACLANDATLNNAKIAVMEKSTEYSFSIKRNAIPFEKSSVEEMVTAMSTNTIDGALLDSFVAGFYQESFASYRLVNIFEHVFSYGLVFTRKGLWIEPNIRDYAQNNKDKIFTYMSSSIRPLKPNQVGSAAEEKSSSLLDIRNYALRSLLVGITSSIAVLVVIGNIWDRCYLRKRFKTTKLEENGPFSWDGPRELTELRETHSIHKLVLLKEIKTEIDNFRDLVKVQLALFHKKNGVFCDEDDLTISNIELVT